jgi:hypothetical protein
MVMNMWQNVTELGVNMTLIAMGIILLIEFGSKMV